MILLPRYGAPDPHFASVVSMSNCQGLDGSTVLRDEKGKVWTPDGNVQIDTGVTLFGGSSHLFDGTGDFWSTPDSADFAMGTGDFTFEAWAYPTGSAGAIRIIFAQQTNIGPQNVIQWRRDASDKLQFVILTAGSVIVNIVSTGSLSIGAWSFLSVSRVGNDWYQHINGSLDGSASSAGAMPDVSQPFYYGTYASDNTSPDLFWLGNFGPHRITKGVGRCGSGSYTPPKGPFPTYGP